MIFLVVADLSRPEALQASSPGYFSGLLVLGLLYEERWIADPQARTIRHIGGIWPLARPIAIPFDSIEGFCLDAFCPRHGARIGRRRSG